MRAGPQISVGGEFAPPDVPAGFTGKTFTRELIAFFIICGFAALPVWIAGYPPMTDLPQHAAQVALLRDLHQPTFGYHDVFQVNWFTPYLLGYLLVFALLPLAGALTASKIVVSFALVALPITTSLVMRETGADRRWAYLTIPGLFGFAYAWGFLNYVVAAPLECRSGSERVMGAPQQYHGTDYRYFVVRSGRDIHEEAFGDASCSVTLRYHHDLWWLYERATPCRMLPQVSETALK